MASVNGRVVHCPRPSSRSGRRWLVPVEFLPRAVAPIYDQRIDLRRASRLLIVGDVMVPRVSGAVRHGRSADARHDRNQPGGAGDDHDRRRDAIILRVDADALDLALPGAGNGLIEQIRAGDQPNTVTCCSRARRAPHAPRQPPPTT